MPVKYYDGSTWVELAESNIQQYDGAAFAALNDASYYDGSAFVSLFGSTTSTTLVDSFEDGGISEYTGDTGEFEVNTSFSTDGSNGLEGFINGTGGRIVSTSGLPAYPSEGDTFRIDNEITQTSSGFFFTAFAVQDYNNFYGVRVDINTNEIGFLKWSGGSFTDLKNVSYSPSANTVLTQEVEWLSGGDFTVRALEGGTEQASVTYTDTAYTSGGIGFNAAGATTRWDNFRIV